jgi:predicted metal-dependent phosphoesterase TrpH
MRQAQTVGLQCIALTDHDSLAGIEEAKTAAGELGIALIAGVELSVRDAEGLEDHLLGFFVDPEAASLQAYLSELQQQRLQMAEQTIQALERLGLAVSRERVNELAKGAVVTRPHIARAMVEAGHVQSETEAFDKYLGSGKPAAPPRPSPTPATAIAAIKQAGGVASLAHPVFSQNSDAAERLQNLRPRVEAMVQAGLQAMECHYPDSTAEITAELLNLAERCSLIATGGSDFHGSGKAPFAPLGTDAVDGDVVERLRALTGSR